MTAVEVLSQAQGRAEGASAGGAPTPDKLLAARAAAGDMSAFEELYWRHNRRVYSVCLRMIRNAAEAEDLTQEVFIQLFRKVGTFRGDSAFTTWLHRMAVNQVMMHLRRPLGKRERTTGDGELPEQVAPGTESARSMPVVDRIALDSAVAELPEGYRKVFLLHDVEGFCHEEVAAILGCSSGTTKSQLHKARRSLRKLLGRQNPPGPKEHVPASD